MGNVTPLSNRTTQSKSSQSLLSQPAPSKLLDRVLKDLDDGQRARVLDLAVRLEIDQDDPLWLIAIATSQLQVLIEDAPDNWSHLFAVFLEEIDQWKHHNLQTLEQMTLEARAVHGLTSSCKTLQSNVSSLQAILLNLIESLERSNQNSRSLKGEFEHLKRDLILSLNVYNPRKSTSNTASRSGAISVQTSPQILARTSRQTWVGSPLLVLGVMAAGFLLSMSQILQIRRSVAEAQRTQQQQIEQLRQEQVSRDCRLGVLPPDSDVCLSL